MSAPLSTELVAAPASTATNDPFVYRLLTRSEWFIAVAQQRYLPTPLDQRDGFIHLSTLSQALTTARLYFPHASDLLLMQINAAGLWPHLRWEAVEARGGQLFPHYYQPHLPLSHVTQLTEMHKDEHTGQHELNPHLAHSALLSQPNSTFSSPLPPLYKILTTTDYHDTTQPTSSPYTGNPKDQSDGFIHLSTLSQLAWVATKYSTTPPTTTLLLLTLHIDRAVDGYRVVWEAANSLRGKSVEFVNLFCHVYPVGVAAGRVASIVLERCVVRVDVLERAADGAIILPSDLQIAQPAQTNVQ